MFILHYHLFIFVYPHFSVNWFANGCQDVTQPSLSISIDSTSTCNITQRNPCVLLGKSAPFFIKQNHLWINAHVYAEKSWFHESILPYQITAGLSPIELSSHLPFVLAVPLSFFLSFFHNSFILYFFLACLVKSIPFKPRNCLWINAPVCAEQLWFHVLVLPYRNIIKTNWLSYLRDMIMIHGPICYSRFMINSSNCVISYLNLNQNSSYPFHIETIKTIETIDARLLLQCHKKNK